VLDGFSRETLQLPHPVSFENGAYAVDVNGRKQTFTKPDELAAFLMETALKKGGHDIDQVRWDPKDSGQYVVSRRNVEQSSRFHSELLRQFGYGLGLVMALSVVSQFANMKTLRLWGQLSDRLTNKSVLRVAAPLFLGCVLSMPFVAVPERHLFTVPVLVLQHVVMGAATAGVGLATGNIALKLAPHGQATAYLASISLFGSVPAGVAPMIGGLFADWFAARELSVAIHWTSPLMEAELTVVRLRHWDFFFVLAFLFGLFAIHRLTLVKEEGEVSERVVVDEFMIATRRAMRSISSVAGLRVATMFPFGLPAAGGDMRPGRRRMRDRRPWSAGKAQQPTRLGDQVRGQEARRPMVGVTGGNADPGQKGEGQEGDAHAGSP
jgi:MFS family permease